MNKEIYHIYTSKRIVLLEINSKLLELGDWKYFDILVFKHQNSKSAIKPGSYKQLQDLLKKYDKVYSFNKVETMLHGAIAYDIILEE